MPFHAAERLLPRMPAAENPGRQARRHATGCCDDREQTGEQRQRERKPAVRALVVRPGSVGSVAFTKRSAAASGSATASMIPIRRTPSTVPEHRATAAGRIGGMQQHLDDGFRARRRPGSHRPGGGACVHHDELLGRGRDARADGRADRAGGARRSASTARTAASSASRGSSPTATPSRTSQTCTCWRRSGAGASASSSCGSRSTAARSADTKWILHTTRHAPALREARLRRARASGRWSGGGWPSA